MSVIHEKYGKERRELLETLKAEDPAAAFYWLERSAFLLDMNGREADVEPTSPAYLKFAKALREIDKRQNPEEKKIEVAYDAALKRADEIHDAETAKAEELYADARQKP